MPVLEGKPVHASRDRAGCRGKLQPNDPLAGAKLGGRGEARCGELELDLALVQPHDEVAPQQFGVGCRFLRGDHAIAVAVHQGEDLAGDGDTRREVDFQPDVAGFDGHKRRLQVFVEPMRENGGGKRKQRKQQQPWTRERQTTKWPDQGFHHLAPYSFVGSR